MDSLSLGRLDDGGHARIGFVRPFALHDARELGSDRVRGPDGHRVLRPRLVTEHFHDCHYRAVRDDGKRKGGLQSMSERDLSPVEGRP